MVPHTHGVWGERTEQSRRWLHRACQRMGLPPEAAIPLIEGTL